MCFHNRCEYLKVVWRRQCLLVAFVVWLLRKCVKCQQYTLNKERCPVCGGEVRIPHPAKFSPEDRYAKYRRAMRGLVQNEDN